MSMSRNYKKISRHGSVCIPAAMRREIGLQGGDPMEVSLDGGTITIKPYTPRCVFCEATEAVTVFYGKGICSSCIREAAQMTKGGNI